jgi:hypothetical protein
LQIALRAVNPSDDNTSHDPLIILSFSYRSDNSGRAAMSLFEVKCPLCKGTLWIDPASGKVVDHQSADHKKGDFGEFMKNRQKGVAWDDRMQKAKDEEARRKAEIEEKFRKARDDKDAGKPDEGVMKSPLDWD